MLHSYDCWWLLKEPVVMCGSWNVRQATSQQLFKMTTFCTDTRFQSFSPLINCIVHHAVLNFSAYVATRRFRNSSVSRIGTRYTRSCKHAPDAVIYRVWGQDCWLATCQDWWTGVSHCAEARLCHERDVLAHCLAGRPTCLQQCCGSLVVASASATRLGNIARWVYCSRLNEDEVGTAEFGYCKSACIVCQSAMRTSCRSVGPYSDIGWISAERGGMQRYLQSDEKVLHFIR